MSVVLKNEKSTFQHYQLLEIRNTTTIYRRSSHFNELIKIVYVFQLESIAFLASNANFMRNELVESS